MDVDKIKEQRSQYVQALLKLVYEDDIEKMMPAPEYESFFPIMYELMKELVKMKQELEDELLLESDYEMQKYIQDELKLVEFKYNLCQKLLKEAERVKGGEVDAGKVNDKGLIFASTLGQSIYFEKDLKDISEEYYDMVDESLRKLESGFQEVNEQKGKSLKNNGKLAGIHEIKPFKVRIFYKNLAPDMVYVLMVKMKKSDNDLLDREEVIIRNKQTLSEYQRLKQLIKNPELRDELVGFHQGIRDEVFNYIAEHRRG